MFNGSLLSEESMDSAIDIQCQPAPLSIAITSPSTIPQIPSHSKFLHLESNMLSLVESNRISLPFLTETNTSKKQSDGKYIKPPAQIKQKIKDVKELGSMKDRYLILPSYNDHDYCLKEIECLKEVEILKKENKKKRNVVTNNLLPLKGHSYLTKCSSKSSISVINLKTEGLTNINLENLSETLCISNSLYEVKAVGATARHEERVRLRRENFLAVMNTDKNSNTVCRNSNFEVKCRSCDGQKTVSELQINTDLICCVHVLPDNVWHTDIHNPSSITSHPTKAVEGAEVASNHTLGKREEQVIHINEDLVSERVASTARLSREHKLANLTYSYQNSSVDTSSTLSFINNVTENIDADYNRNVAKDHGNCKSSILQSTEETKSFYDSEENYPDLVTPTQKLSWNVELSAESVENPQIGNANSSQKNEANDNKAKCSELTIKYDIKSAVNKPTHTLSEWISITEGWLRDVLDVEDMLKLI